MNSNYMEIDSKTKNGADWEKREAKITFQVRSSQ